MRTYISIKTHYYACIYTHPYASNVWIDIYVTLYLTDDYSSYHSVRFWIYNHWFIELFHKGKELRTHALIRQDWRNISISSRTPLCIKENGLYDECQKIYIFIIFVKHKKLFLFYFSDISTAISWKSFPKEFLNIANLRYCKKQKRLSEWYF